jgi:hypothetical protein
MRVVHSEIRYRSQSGRSPSAVAVPARTRAAIGTAIGLAGGIAMAVPIVLYDLFSSSHSVWELPMAATSWVFGLSHFTQNGVQWWSVVIGTLLLAAFAIACGEIFEALADRFLRVRTTAETVGTGLAWGFVSWLFVWYTLLPIAHDGAPFYATVTSLALPLGTVSVAPIWTFVLGFALLGLATSYSYRLLRSR